MQPILSDRVTLQRYYQYYYHLHKIVDDPSRGPDQANWVGIRVGSVVQPNHIETVIATLDGGTGPKIWKHSRYFDRGRSSMP